MAVEECPHCFRKVLASPTRACPSCRGMLDEPPQDSRTGKKLVWLTKTAVLPKICVQCGNATEDSIRLQSFTVTRKRAFADNIFTSRPNLVLALIGLVRPEIAANEGFRILRHVHCCKRCRNLNRPGIHEVDHVNFRIGILVDSAVAAHLLAKTKTS